MTHNYLFFFFLWIDNFGMCFVFFFFEFPSRMELLFTHSSDQLVIHDCADSLLPSFFHSLRSSLPRMRSLLKWPACMQTLVSGSDFWRTEGLIYRLIQDEDIYNTYYTLYTKYAVDNKSCDFCLLNSVH